MAKHKLVKNRITNFLNDGAKHFKEIELHLQKWQFHPSPHQLTGILTAHYELQLLMYMVMVMKLVFGQ